jgi:hypothetical protein
MGLQLKFGGHALPDIVSFPGIQIKVAGMVDEADKKSG